MTEGQVDPKDGGVGSAARIADLHLHSNASDGSDAPERVVQRVHAAGYSAMALADHDTVDGVEEAWGEARRLGITFIPAVELSCLEGPREIHVLGYGVDVRNEGLRAMLRRILDARENRAYYMVERLNQLGVRIRWERVQELAGNENVGRPHIARAMLEAGYIRTISEAFTEEYIANGGKAYFERYRLTPEEGIQIIRAAGGVPVLAHPGRFRDDGDDDDPLTEQFVRRLVAVGLQGIEVFYPLHTEAMVRLYGEMAGRLGLLVTGGSDDHGENADTRRLGQVALEWRYVEALVAAIEANRAGLEAAAGGA